MGYQVCPLKIRNKELDREHGPPKVLLNLKELPK